MHNEQDWAPENVRDLVQEHFEKNTTTTTSFSFDDAFSDADDGDANYALSSFVIRADLARAISHSQEGKEQEGAGESSGTGATEGTREPSPELSVFVFSIQFPCSSMRALPLCRDTSSPNRDANNLDTKFDSVSLSESPVEKLPHAEYHHYDVQEKSEVTDEEHEQRHTGNDSTSETQPIDAEDSHSDPVALDATQESQPPSPPQSDVPPNTSASEDKPETPPGQTNRDRSASTPSLPLPPVVTPPAPSSSSPPPSINHKPSRSVGPSIFERVVSKTRPSFLPPKSRDEDQKHLADWERMMKRSRAAGTP